MTTMQQNDGLREYLPEAVREQVWPMLQSTVADYATTLFAGTGPAIDETAAVARRGLADCFAATRAQDPPAGDRTLVHEILHGAPIQTGPHPILTLDPDTYCSFGLAVLGALRNGRHNAIVFQTNTVTLQQAAMVGPGWLDLDEPFNVFALSRRQLSNTSACAPIANLSFRHLIDRLAPEVSAGSVGERVLELLSQVKGATVAGIVRDANERLWSDWGRALGVRTHIIDEQFVSDLLLYHSRRGTALWECFVRLVDGGSGGSGGCGIPDVATLFWGLREGRIRRLSVEDGWLRDASSSQAWVRTDRDAIVAALEAGTLIPRLFTCFLFLTIAPRLRAVGGVRYVRYFPSFAREAASLLGSPPRGPDGEARRFDELVGWGHQLWPRPCFSVADLLERRSATDLLAAFDHQTLVEATNRVELFRRTARQDDGTE